MDNNSLKEVALRREHSKNSYLIADDQLRIRILQAYARSESLEEVYGHTSYQPDSIEFILDDMCEAVYQLSLLGWSKHATMALCGVELFSEIDRVYDRGKRVERDRVTKKALKMSFEGMRGYNGC